MTFGNICIEEDKRLQHDIYRKIIMNTSVGFAFYKVIISRTGEPSDYEFIEVNDFFGKIVGYDLDKIKGKKLSETYKLFNIDDFDWMKAFRDNLKTEDVKAFTFYSQNLNRYFSLNNIIISKKHFVTILNDITDNQGKIQTDETQIRLIIDTIEEGIVCIDNSRKCVFCNSKALKILGFALEDVLEKPIEDLVSDINGERLFSPLVTYEELTSGTEKTIYWHKNNVYLNFTSRNQYYNGEKIGTIIIFYNVNSEIETQSQLVKQQQENGLLLRNLPGMVYRSKLKRNEPLEYVSEGSLELTGYPNHMFIKNGELTLADLICDSQKEHIQYLWEEAITSGEHFKEEYLIKTANGEKKWVLDSARLIFNENNEVEAVEGLIINIDNLKNKQDEVEYLSDHDQLTGLYNRIYFENNKNKYIQDRFMPLTIMMVDINGLRFINESAGVLEGDNVILTAVRIIKSSCRETDLIVRIDGTSFLILMPNRNYVQNVEVYNKIKSICDRYNEGVSVAANHLHLSIGFATQSSSEQSFDETRIAAEDAMYKNKLLDNSSSHYALITSITSTLFECNHETEMHSYRIKQLAKQIGQVLGLAPDKLDELLLLASLHDIGKVAVSNQILTKPGPLSPEEWVEMKKHPVVGYRITMASPLLKPISNYILSHHERWDGNGYPRGLKGTEIPLLSRVISVVDAYDAMTEDRPYRKKMTIDTTLKEIKENAGTQFDPHIANIFIKMISNYNQEK